MGEFDFVVVEAGGAQVGGVFDNQVEACEEAQRHSENNDVDCHVADGFGHVVETFGR